MLGIIAKFLHPGPNEPSGFIPTTILGIVGALVATYLGRAIRGRRVSPAKAERLPSAFGAMYMVSRSIF